MDIDPGPVSSSSTSKHAIVCGAGVIGACTAYYLSQKGVKVTVVEKCHVASSASGKAGGFLALDWCKGPTDQLARVSFRLHEQLADELNGSDFGYRRVETLSVTIRESSPSSANKKTPGGNGFLPEWIDGPVSRSSSIGSPLDTAQVHPKLFTETILKKAMENYGVQLVIGDVQEVVLKKQTDDIAEQGTTKAKMVEKVSGVIVDGKEIPADIVVIAMGPWSSHNKLVGRLTQISGLKAHSIVLKPSNANLISPHMLFLQYRTKEGKSMEPEVYPRATGEVYVCGVSEDVKTPKNPLDVQPSDGASSVLRQVAATVSSHLADADCVVEQACLLPCSEDGMPLIGAIPGVEGAYVGTGHSCWGILNGPGTGLALAELIAEGVSKTVNLKAFDPQRFLVGAHRR